MCARESGVAAYVFVRIEDLDNRIAAAMTIGTMAMTITSSAYTNTNSHTHTRARSVQFRCGMHARSTNFTNLQRLFSFLLIRLAVCPSLFASVTFLFRLRSVLVFWGMNEQNWNGNQLNVAQSTANGQQKRRNTVAFRCRLDFRSEMNLNWLIYSIARAQLS